MLCFCIFHSIFIVLPYMLSFYSLTFIFFCFIMPVISTLVADVEACFLDFHPYFCLKKQTKAQVLWSTLLHTNERHLYRWNFIVRTCVVCIYFTIKSCFIVSLYSILTKSSCYKISSRSDQSKWYAYVYDIIHSLFSNIFSIYFLL